MTVFLILIILALLALTVWQMSKIFKLSQSKKEVEHPNLINNKDNRVNGYLMAAFGVFFFGLMLFSFWKYTKLYPPKAATAEGVEIDQLMFITFAILMIVQVITQFLLFYYGYKYRGKKNGTAKFIPENEKLEFVWTIIPVITLSALIIYGLFTWSDIMNVKDADEDEDVMVVELYAYQFGWKARYSGEDNTLGKANVRNIEGANSLGLDESDPYGDDDIIASELHLPKGKKVLFKMRSQDVIHSAYFPHFRAQMNVVPGMITQFQITPEITTEEMRRRPSMQKRVKNINEIRAENGDSEYDFDYFLLCNKVCGSSHYNMQMKVVVEEQDEFKDWLADQDTFEEKMDGS